jgi:hypothetical protein
LGRRRAEQGRRIIISIEWGGALSLA